MSYCLPLTETSVKKKTKKEEVPMNYTKGEYILSRKTSRMDVTKKQKHPKKTKRGTTKKHTTPEDPPPPPKHPHKKPGKTPH